MSRARTMTGTTRFVCTDPDAGDFEFADVDAVLDALEAALVQPATPLFDAARQSWQPVGMHPEIRAAWEARLRYRPPAASGLGLPALPSHDGAGPKPARRGGRARSAPRRLRADAGRRCRSRSGRTARTTRASRGSPRSG